MRIIDRYISRSLYLAFLANLIIFTLLFILIDSASNLDEFLKQHVSLSVLLQYYLYYTPVVIVQTASMAALIAALLIYTHLSSHNEIIALRSSGLNFWQLGRPALVFALLVSFMILVINEKFIPTAEDRSQKIRNENIVIESKNPQRRRPVINNLTFYGLKSRLYFIDTFDPNIGKLSGITIIGYDDKYDIKEKIVAYEGRWTGLAWKFYQCHITSYEAGVAGSSPIKVYPEKLMDIQETPQDFLNQRLNVASMSSRQLQDYIQRFSKSGAQRAVTNLRIDLYQKISTPFSTVVIILVGLPLAMRSGRRKAQNFTALALAVAIGFLYYVCNAVALALGKGGAIYPPVLAAGLAPLLFLGLAYYLIKENS